MSTLSLAIDRASRLIHSQPMVEKTKNIDFATAEIVKGLIDRSGKTDAAISREIRDRGGKATPQAVGKWKRIGTISRINMQLLQQITLEQAPDFSQPVEKPLSSEAADYRSKNNVKALRFAIQSLFSVLHERMQDVAEDVARDIVATAGTEFAGQGFLNILVGNLRGAEHMSATERLVPRPVPVSPASKRVISGARKT